MEIMMAMPASLFEAVQISLMCHRIYPYSGWLRMSPLHQIFEHAKIYNPNGNYRILDK
jgi:hypothetical protein